MWTHGAAGGPVALPSRPSPLLRRRRRGAAEEAEAVAAVHRGAHGGVVLRRAHGGGAEVAPGEVGRVDKGQDT